MTNILEFLKDVPLRRTTSSTDSKPWGRRYATPLDLVAAFVIPESKINIGDAEKVFDDFVGERAVDDKAIQKLSMVDSLSVPEFIRANACPTFGIRLQYTHAHYILDREINLPETVWRQPF